ncbi:MAG: OmpW family outer membrane protein [Caulobacteraceae bacterium]
MSKHRFRVAAAAAGMALAAAGVACAQAVDSDFQPKTKGTWILDLRATDVIPENYHPILTGAGAATGLKAHVSSDIKPTLGITYFLTDHIAVEAIAGATRHEIDAVNASGQHTRVRDAWVLPPVVALQYHFLPAARFSPYLGAGVNYMWFYSGDDKNGFTTHLDNGFGWALQGGLDYQITGPWTVNADVKKIFFDTTARIDGGALTSRVDLNPWVISAGFGRKF